jgi:hypothetical protein
MEARKDEKQLCEFDREIKGCETIVSARAVVSPQKPGFNPRAAHLSFVVDSGIGTSVVIQ